MVLLQLKDPLKLFAQRRQLIRLWISILMYYLSCRMLRNEQLLPSHALSPIHEGGIRVSFDEEWVGAVHVTHIGTPSSLGVYLNL